MIDTRGSTIASRLTAPTGMDTRNPAGVARYVSARRGGGFIDGHADYVTGRGSLKEWQWYGESTGAGFVRELTTKVSWNVYQEAQ